MNARKQPKPRQVRAAAEPKPPLPRRFAAWLRRSWPAILILILTTGVFFYLFFTANQGRIFRNEASREEGQRTVNGETVQVTVERAKVINLSKDTVNPDPMNPDGKEKGTQRALIELRSGPHAGERFELDVMPGWYTDDKLELGSLITIAVAENLDTGEIQFDSSTYSHDRSIGVYVVLGLFLLVVLLVGGRTGLKSLLGLVFTVVALIWIFCPLWMKGAEPVPLAFGLCVLVSVMSFTILGGVSRKTICAVLGTVAGMGLAALFSFLAQRICKIDSYALYDAGRDFVDLANLQQRGYDLHLQGLLSAGIIIASLGAVMDVAMSLSSAVSELKTVNQSLGFAGLWRSGMRIGRDMVGTMTNTLILAFVGSSLVLVLRLWSQGPSYIRLISSRYLSVELISALSSSIGVILAVPLTALIGAAFFGKAKSRQ